MAVFTPSYPLTLPTATGIVTQNFSLTRAVAVTTSPFTFQTQVHQHQGEFWQTVVSLPPMLRANANLWLSFLLQLRGRRGTFKIGDQDAKTITGVATGTIRVNGASQTFLTLASLFDPLALILSPAGKVFAWPVLQM